MNKKNPDESIKFVAKENMIFKRDEKLLILLYRFIKNNWKFFAGVIITGLILGYFR